MRPKGIQYKAPEPLIRAKKKKLLKKEVAAIVGGMVIVLVLVISVVILRGYRPGGEILESEIVELPYEDEKPADMVQVTGLEVRDNKILFASGGKIYIINSGGSDKKRLTDNRNTNYFDCLPDGSKILFLEYSAGESEISIIDSQGSVIKKLTVNNKIVYYPVISPDGSRIAFISADRIYVINSDGTGSAKIIDNNFRISDLSWSPNSLNIAFLSEKGYFTKIFTTRYDGTSLTQITEGNSYDTQPAWSPDGSRIAFSSKDVSGIGKWNIFIIDSDGSEISNLFESDSDDTQPAWSPDGSRIAFTSNCDGDNEIFAVDIDGFNLIQLTDNTIDDRSPVWSPDGSKIAYISTGYFRKICTIDSDGLGKKIVTGISPDTEYLFWVGSDNINETQVTENKDSITIEEDSGKEELIGEPIKAPTINLIVYEGPAHSEVDGVCYYRIRADVEGNPAPTVIFSKDDSNGALGLNKTQINLYNQDDSYALTAAATNSEGTITDTIELTWRCEEESNQKDSKDVEVYNESVDINDTLKDANFIYDNMVAGLNYSSKDPIHKSSDGSYRGSVNINVDDINNITSIWDQAFTTVDNNLKNMDFVNVTTYNSYGDYHIIGFTSSKGIKGEAIFGRDWDRSQVFITYVYGWSRY
jgi:hypothetical protein